MPVSLPVTCQRRQLALSLFWACNFNSLSTEAH
jgi:hypothetical protein